jgi:hypothetical protein
MEMGGAAEAAGDTLCGLCDE